MKKYSIRINYSVYLNKKRSDIMEYNIMGNVMPVVEMKLDRGEAVFTQSGGMCWMSNGVDMSTNTRGGLMKGIGRMFAGESLFMTTYTASENDATIAFSATVPGEVVPVDLRGGKVLFVRKVHFYVQKMM